MSLNPTFPQVADRDSPIRTRTPPSPASRLLGRISVHARGVHLRLRLLLLLSGQRGLSPKHALLKPSGTIGLHLGMFGFFLFLLLYLYPIRLRWAWLGRQGSSRHWLDFHVLLGLIAPLIITFHSSFKFGGIAGVAYWIMIFVALSGLVGRYIYAQIPRTLNFAELSLKEGQEQGAKLAEQIKNLGILSARDIEGLLHLPGMRQAEQMSLLSALWKMMVFDLVFPFRVWRLRQKMLWSHRRWWSFVGFGAARTSPSNALSHSPRSRRC